MKSTILPVGPSPAGADQPQSTGSFKGLVEATGQTSARKIRETLRLLWPQTTRLLGAKPFRRADFRRSGQPQVRNLHAFTALCQLLKHCLNAKLGSNPNYQEKTEPRSDINSKAQNHMIDM